MRLRWNLSVLAGAVVLSLGMLGQAQAADNAGGVLARGATFHVGIPRGVGDPVVYDSTGGDFTTTGSSPRTFTGITDVRASLTLRGNATVPVSLQSFDVE